MDYLEVIDENYSYFNDYIDVVIGANSFLEVKDENYSYFNTVIDTVTQAPTGNTYNQLINENYSFNNTVSNALIIKVIDSYNYSSNAIAPLRISEKLVDSYTYNTDSLVKKLIVLSFEDSFSYNNQNMTTADYLQSISENYQVKTVLNTYKEVNGNLELDDTLDCWVINYETNAVSRYSNYVFDSFTNFNGNVYGVNDLGLFKLGGKTDNSKDIKSKVLTGSIDISGLGSQTYVRDIFIYHKSDGTLRLNVIANDGKVENYRLINTSDETISSKLPLSKGRKAIYWQFELTNDDQTNFEIEKIKVYKLITGKIT